MSIFGQSVEVAKKLIFADTLIPQEFTIGLPEPQTEIAVWLHGIGAPLEITGRYTTACCGPLVLCISFEKGQQLDAETLRNASVQFRERGGQNHLLGKIGLSFWRIIPLDDADLVLFIAVSSTNYCLPRKRLWPHYALHTLGSLRRSRGAGESMTLVEQRAAIVTFIRPHPLSLVSLVGEAGGNIFPMNLMGDLGHSYFGFALTVTRLAGRLVQGAGRIAVSSVPLAKCSTALDLVPNHRKQSIDWDQLPFELRMSPKFGIPVPVFASRVREMEVLNVLDMGNRGRKGTHAFFIARVISDQRFSEDLSVNTIHGFYQCWRLRGQSEMLKVSIAQDSINKTRVDATKISGQNRV